MINFPPKVKICGLSRLEDVQAVNEYDADFAGFIFWPKSPRFVTIDQAAELRKHLKPGIRAVGVFVDTPVEAVAAIVDMGIIDIVQLHGKENGHYIAQLRSLVRCEIIKAVKVETEEDILEADRCKADYILLDNGKGTGEKFDWKALERAEKKLEHLYFLAGGLCEENLPEAISAFHPFVFDLNSGVETGLRKDPDKIRKCIYMIRNTRVYEFRTPWKK